MTFDGRKRDRATTGLRAGDRSADGVAVRGCEFRAIPLEVNDEFLAECRALLLNPGLLLADEPTGNLDPETSQQILQLLLSQAREHAATLIMVTHDHSLLNQFDQVIAFSELTCPQVA